MNKSLVKINTIIFTLIFMFSNFSLNSITNDNAKINIEPDGYSIITIDENKDIIIIESENKNDGITVIVPKQLEKERNEFSRIWERIW